jgi:hypothetical protein
MAFRQNHDLDHTDDSIHLAHNDDFIDDYFLPNNNCKYLKLRFKDDIINVPESDSIELIVVSF